MWKVIEIDTRDRHQSRRFLDLPRRIYAGNPCWVPMLEMDARRMLDRDRHPFYRHSDAAFFLLEQDGADAGRLAVLDNRHYNEYNHAASAFFYLFECAQELEGAAQALFEAAFAWARGRGLAEMIGPKGFTALDGMGLLVKGFEHRPALGIPYNLPTYPGLIEAAGFQPDGDTVSGRVTRGFQLPEKIHFAARAVQERMGLRVMRFRTRADLRGFVPRLKELYNGALEGTTGNTPLTDDEARSMAAQILWFADPRLIKLILKGDEMAGFLFAYPDISAAIQRTGGRLWPFGWADTAPGAAPDQMGEHQRGGGAAALPRDGRHRPALQRDLRQHQPGGLRVCRYCADRGGQPAHAERAARPEYRFLQNPPHVQTGVVTLHPQP